METSAGQAVWLRFVQVGSAQCWTDRGSSFAPGLVAPGLAPGFAREQMSLHYATATVRPSLERGRCAAVSIPFANTAMTEMCGRPAPSALRRAPPPFAVKRVVAGPLDRLEHVGQTAEPHRRKRVQLAHRQRIRAVEAGADDKLPARGGERLTGQDLPKP